MFSPYYAWSGRARPDDHLAFNVALYGPKARWAMTERGARHGQRDEARYQLGASSATWEGQSLVLQIDERSAPLFQPVRGVVQVECGPMPGMAYDLTEDGRHVWAPVAPVSRVTVAFDQPGLSWTGSAYLDSNWGAEPLEDGFARWDWARFDGGEGCTVAWDLMPRRGAPLQTGIAFGLAARPALPAFKPLPPTLWQIRRQLPCDPGATPEVLASFEDVPFYARTHVATTLSGQRVTGVHETVDGDRLRQGWVKALLPFRMPRIA